MKCDQAGTWLLMSDSPAEPPKPVAQHLNSCPSCREMRARLLQLEGELSAMPLPDESVAAKQRFLGSIAGLPSRQDSEVVRRKLPNPVRSPKRRSLAFVGVTAASVVFAFFAGWVVSSVRHTDSNENEPVVDKTNLASDEKQHEQDAPQIGEHKNRDDERGDTEHQQPLRVPREAPARQVTRSEFAILEPLIENHIQLAAADRRDERFVLVGKMSNVVWNEIVRQVEVGPSDDLLLLGQLYNDIVIHGLPRRARLLLPEDQKTKQEAVNELLTRKEKSQELARDAIPVVAEILARTAESSDRSAKWIVAGDEPGVAQPHSLSPAANNILSIVVNHNLELAEESDPLRRANHSSDVADHLSDMIVFTSLRGDTDRSEELGAYLGDIVDRGVTINLARFEPEGPDDPRLEEVERIKKRSQRSIDVLKRNLERVPEPARKGLRRALEAQERGRGRGRKNGNGAAPGRSGEFVPPGLRGRDPKEKKNLPPGTRKEKPAIERDKDDGKLT